MDFFAVFDDLKEGDLINFVQKKKKKKKKKKKIGPSQFYLEVLTNIMAGVVNFQEIFQNHPGRDPVINDMSYPSLSTPITQNIMKKNLGQLLDKSVLIFQGFFFVWWRPHIKPKRLMIWGTKNHMDFTKVNV